ncbi:PucR family transcriptional regulator [Mycobacterium sp. SVM_VP21]|nr:PucR family transcriptional regulator [Mycobacterium sp. SVM_VP21]
MWERPSARVCELMRQGAELMVNVPEPQLGELDRAILASEHMQGIGSDPVLADAIRRNNRSNLLHWAAANISRPGEPVPPNTREPLAIARDLIRRGIDIPWSVDAYRLGQNAAWRFWMRFAFRLTSDPDELHELLDVSAQSIGSFIDATVTEVYRQIQSEREELTGGTHAERRQAVALILDGAPVDRRHVETQLGYRLDQHHTAAVIWGTESETTLADLDRAAEVLTGGPSSRPSLSIVVSSATRWTWLPGVEGPDLTRLADAVRDLPGIRIAVGPTESGIEGFRRSHFDAITAQHTMARSNSHQQVARFTDVELIALITADPERADRFVKHALGDFESADEELHRAVLTFIGEQCNASRAAARLYTHRNTLLRRVSRADELLPRPLEENSVHIAVALEALLWR